MKHIPEGQGTWQQCPGYAKKILLGEDDLGQPGTLVQLIEIAPYTAVGDHRHEHCTEVFHGLSGQGVFVVDGKAVTLGPGDTLTCRPGEVHSTRNDGEETFRYIVFKTNARAGDIHWLKDEQP